MPTGELETAGAADQVDYANATFKYFHGIGADGGPAQPAEAVESFISPGSKIGEPKPNLIDNMTATIDGLQVVLAQIASAADEAVEFARKSTLGAVAAGVKVDLTYVRDAYDEWGRELCITIAALERLRNQARLAEQGSA